MALTQHDTSLLLKTLGHPVRAGILRILEPGRIASPRQMADELERPLAVVAYHVRRLRDTGFIELVSHRPVRGTVEHFYRATARPIFENEVWRQMTEQERTAISQTIATAMIQDILGAAANTSTQSQADLHMTRAPLKLDAEAWTELESEMTNLLSKAHDLQGEATNRIAEGQSEPLNGRLTLLLFEAGPPGMGGRTIS